MIEITQEELWAFNILDGSIRNIMAEAQRSQAARDSFINLLEGKYDAVFDPQTGKLEPKPEASKELEQESG